MDIKEHYESRFAQLEQQLDRSTPGLKNYFFLVYERPDGTFQETLGTDHKGLMAEMRLKATEIHKPHAEVRYMCRRLGEPYCMDTEEPEMFVNKPLDELIVEVRETIRQMGGLGQ